MKQKINGAPLRSMQGMFAMCMALMVGQSHAYEWTGDLGSTYYDCEFRPVAGSNKTPTWVGVNGPGALYLAGGRQAFTLATVSTGLYQIIPQNRDNSCVTTRGPQDGALNVAQGCSNKGIPNQQVWRLQPFGGGRFKIISMSTSGAWDEQNGHAPGPIVYNWHQVANNNSQLFYIQNCKNMNGVGTSPAGR